ncbi:unnamed protein product [Trichogramma brassicae]|uniref:Uncharacterized protein n=1 Tax=Trichogramma brassicae TaxID=86971 RepID=A0A6H5J205_9HYME|nr:unnamed protein product [Trichogramma brassicae]
METQPLQDRQFHQDVGLLSHLRRHRGLCAKIVSLTLIVHSVSLSTFSTRPIFQKLIHGRISYTYSTFRDRTHRSYHQSLGLNDGLAVVGRRIAQYHGRAHHRREKEDEQQDPIADQRDLLPLELGALAAVLLQQASLVALDRRLDAADHARPLAAAAVQSRRRVVILARFCRKDE